MEHYELIRSRRKTLVLEITKDCRILVRAPMRLPQAHIDAFVEQHADWIARHLAQQQARLAAAPPAPTPEEIAALKEKARAVLPPKIAYWSEKMGVTSTGFKVTTARKRYGSCSGRNAISFSWRLMQDPEEAIDYVVVHELAHIRHKNHSRAFYQEVARYLPDYAAREAKLRG